jgi:hypothetical protein
LALWGIASIPQRNAERRGEERRGEERRGWSGVHPKSETAD